MQLQALREKRLEVANQMAAHVGKDGAFTADDQAKFDAMKAEVESIDRQIENIEHSLKLQAALAAGADETAGVRSVSVENAAELRREILTAYLREGRAGVEAMAREGRIQNAQSVGTNSAGGFSVQRELFGQIIEAMKAYGGMRNVATVISTDNGAPLDFVTTNATSETGRILAENANSTATDTTFGTASILAYKYSSDVIAVSLELLQDSAFDIEAYIVKLLGMRLGRITNTHFTVGTGTSQPAGVVAGAAAGKVGATGQTTSVTLDDLVALEHSVDPLYRANGAWMLHDTSLAKIKGLKDTTGRPIWLPGIAAGAPDTLLGYRYVINQDVAQMAANAKSILFGDLSKYLIRDVMGATLYRNSDSKYNELGQVGFHAILRTGGALIDVGGAIKHYANSAT